MYRIHQHIFEATSMIIMKKNTHIHTHTHTHTHTKGSKRKQNIMKNHIQNNRREKKVNKNKI
jgi:hypothetical protein